MHHRTSPQVRPHVRQHVRPLLGLSLLLCSLLACGPGSPADVCAAKATAMRTLFAQAEKEPAMIATRPGMQLPESSRGGAVDDGIPLYIEADGRFVFQDQPVPPEELAELLTEEFDKAIQLGEIIGRPWKGRMIVVADVRAPAAILASLAATLPPDMALSLIVNLAGDTVPIAPPIPPAVQAALNVPAYERSGTLAEVIKAASGTCEPVFAAFDAVAATTADQRSNVLLAGLPAAIEKCGCVGVDVDALVAAVWGMSGKFEPSKRYIDLPLSRDPAAEALPLAPGATVREVLALTETRGGKPFRLPLTP